MTSGAEWRGEGGKAGLSLPQLTHHPPLPRFIHSRCTLQASSPSRLCSLHPVHPIASSEFIREFTTGLLDWWCRSVARKGGTRELNARRSFP